MTLRIARAVLFLPVVMLLTLASLPWVFVSMGAAFAGDHDLSERALLTAPVSRFLAGVIV